MKKEEIEEEEEAIGVSSGYLCGTLTELFSRFFRAQRDFLSKNWELAIFDFYNLLFKVPLERTWNQVL